MGNTPLYSFGRRAFLAGLLASAATPMTAGVLDRSLRPPMRTIGSDGASFATADALVSKAKLSGDVGFAVADAKTGLMLETRAETSRAAPASVTKAITALYALDVLGPDHRFATQLLRTGPLENGVLKGDLVLAGGGDPTLGTDDLATLAAAMKDTGLREVRGNFVIFDGALASAWSIDTDQPDHVSYNPAISGIALNFNRVHFEWKRSSAGFAVTMDARSERYRPDVAMARMKIADRASPVFTYSNGVDRENWTVAKAALGTGGARWLPVRKPALYAADVFATMARSHGIVLKSPTVTSRPVEGAVLAQHFSGSLRSILEDMLRYSTNITAEMVGMSASARRLGSVPTLRTSAAEMNAWAKAELGMQSPALVDHSGLGAANRLSPQDMVRSLVRAHQTEQLRPILKQITLRDAKGRPNKGHALTVEAKTGTLNFVSCLAGYLTVPDGRVLAFAMFTADETQRALIPREDRERPPGARSWNQRSKALQQSLLERWGQVYAG